MNRIYIAILLLLWVQPAGAQELILFKKVCKTQEFGFLC